MLRLKRIFVVLTVIVVVVAVAAVPAMAQNADKAAKKAAKQAQKAAVPAGGAGPNAAPANVGAQKALPSSGGMSAGNIALLGTGALLVGGGVLLHRTAARP